MEPQVMTIRKSIARSDRRSVKGIDMWSMDADEFVRNEQASRKNARGISNKFSLFETLELLAIKTKRNPVTGLGLVIPKLLAQLETFRNLSPNWDSYGALPTEERALARARQLLNSLSLQLVYAPAVSVHVFPMRDGGIQVELDRDNASMEIEVHPDGTEDYLLFTAQGALIGTYTSLFAALRHFIDPPRPASNT
ncbi:MULTISPECIES: hypothetical protein [Hymenobacter]|jgi:hypothetical protein|uniref:Uncharacterized protein n=2 Tax=Hymenobacter TaxID=89966 RepID=A0A428IYW7_9BACT|nr:MULTISPECIES: hypothetical protein [Hymenobacter]AII54474.1 hypothetical protein N008_21350 [Hymenobacter sp. APR13]RSK24530.1 hypothetical protein EI290_19460 [Hymenobacter metallilatus]TGE03509.1 hypothetical protein EU556_25290 [Hymenobacter fodinae]